MNILDRAKKRIGFQAARKWQSEEIDESAAPFQYEYVSISHVLGARLPDGSPDPLPIAQFPGIHAKAYLTQNWDKQYFHIDRANSIAMLLLTGGFTRFTTISKYVNRFLLWLFGPEWVFMRNFQAQIARTRELRIKEHAGSGCCMVFLARGDVTHPVDLSASQKFGEVGVALDAFDGSVIRQEHQLNVRNLATSVSIAMTETSGSPEIRFLADNVHLIDKNGLVIYVRNVEMGAVGMVVTTVPTAEFVATVESYSASLSADAKLSSAASVFALSQRKSNDNLRSFIASWSALELLIYNLEKKYRSVFQNLLVSSDVILPASDKDLRSTDIADYRLRDRFYAVACSANLSEAVADTEYFNSLNSKRNDYYHRLDIKDTELPTHDVQKLFRKYLKIALSESRAASLMN